MPTELQREESVCTDVRRLPALRSHSPPNRSSPLQRRIARPLPAREGSLFCGLRCHEPGPHTPRRRSRSQQHQQQPSLTVTVMPEPLCGQGSAPGVSPVRLDTTNTTRNALDQEAQGGTTWTKFPRLPDSTPNPPIPLLPHSPQDLPHLTTPRSLLSFGPVHVPTCPLRLTATSAFHDQARSIIAFSSANPRLRPPQPLNKRHPLVAGWADHCMGSLHLLRLPPGRPGHSVTPPHHLGYLVLPDFRFVWAASQDCPGFFSAPGPKENDSLRRLDRGQRYSSS